MLKILLPVLLVVVGSSISLIWVGALIGFVGSLQKHISDSAAHSSHKFKDLAHGA